jgi:hypothetical protein
MQYYTHYYVPLVAKSDDLSHSIEEAKKKFVKKNKTATKVQCQADGAWRFFPQCGWQVLKYFISAQPKPSAIGG